MKTLKKVLIFLIVLVSVICLIPSYNVKADSLVLTMTNGASIRTTGDQGLRYLCTASSDFEEGVEHGYYLVKGKQTKADLTAAIENGDSSLGGNKLVKKVATGTSASFAVTVINIDDANYDKEISVIAYAKVNDEFVFSDVSVTRNVYDTAREYFNVYKNKSSKNATIISIVENNARVKVENGDTVKYYSSFTNFVKSPKIQEGDRISLVSLSFNNELVIDKNNVTIIGAQNTPTNKSNDSRGNETIFTKNINVAAGVENLKLSGLNIQGTTGIKLEGDTDGLTITNNMFNHSGISAIVDTRSSDVHTNITIEGNTFNGSKTEYQKIVYIMGTANNYEISNNLFVDKATSITLENKGTEETPDLSPNSYGIKINKIAENGTVNIKDNEFNCYGSDWVIDINSNNSTKSSITVNVENNKMSLSSEKSLQGNGIRVSYLKAESNVSIIHNFAFKVSTYYNAVTISNTTSAKPDDVESISLKLKYNLFYIDEPTGENNQVEKPASRKETSAFTRIGLGFSTASSVDIGENYFSGSTSKYAYYNFASASATANANTSSLITNKTASESAADAAYQAYLAS